MYYYVSCNLQTTARQRQSIEQNLEIVPFFLVYGNLVGCCSWGLFVVCGKGKKINEEWVRDETQCEI